MVSRKLRSRRGSGIADQMLKSAPESCEIKIICEGNEVVIDKQAVVVESSSPSPRSNANEDGSFSKSKSKSMQEEDKRDESAVSCKCFASRFL